MLIRQDGEADGRDAESGFCLGSGTLRPQASLEEGLQMHPKIPVVCPLCLAASAIMSALPFLPLWGGKQEMPAAMLIKSQSPGVLLLSFLLRASILGQMCRSVSY